MDQAELLMHVVAFCAGVVLGGLLTLWLTDRR
jgi:uncharacterized membrane protein YoaK (UPF0700 family)